MLTFDQLLEEYFFLRHLRPRSQTSYRSAVAQLQKFMSMCGMTLPDELTNRDVFSWRKLALTQMREVSWNSYVRHLRALWSFGIDQGLLESKANPFKGTQVGEPKRPKKTLTTSQIHQARVVLQQMEAWEEENKERSRITPAWFWQVVNETFYSTGLRLNQVLNVRLADVDLSDRLIMATVEGSKTKREYPVPISSQYHPWISMLVDRAKFQKFKQSDQLFNVNRFSPYHRRTTMNSWQVESCYAKISDITRSKISPHRFRHTIGTDLMKKPERNLHLVKELLGHTNIKTTLEYVSVDVEMLRECVER
ncbi:tyrosine-type recombinase/integrase [Pseudomonas sp. NCHU5208]|uniref:tyrosine-type recombinase/integrase n=1 Tax=unclassified Pseudomonas TaxID=196821 RepID=UPI003F9B6D61